MNNIQNSATEKPELQKVVLYGAGTQNLRMAIQPIASAGYEITAICDKDPEKIGTKFLGRDIISPKELAQFDQKSEPYILVITIRTPEIVKEVRGELSNLQNAEVYTFEDFISFSKLNSRCVRFSCLMVHLVDDCNLNCVRCSHFSPLAPKGGFYLDVEEFERDCAKLSELTGGDVDEFQLSGGEPTTHPEVEKFPYIIKKYFPKTQITMITNATKLANAKESLIQSFVDNNLFLMITKYPINLPFDKIEDKLKKHGVFYEFGNTGNTGDKDKQKEMWGLPLVLEGGLDGSYNFDGCLCMQYIMRDGRIYPCANSAYIDLFNNFFDQNLPGPEVNGVDFRNAKTIKEVTDAISTPSPLCSFCDARKRMAGVPWSLSKKEISEWILSEDEESQL